MKYFYRDGQLMVSGVEWTDLFLSHDDHWLILRDFVRSLLYETGLGLLIEGVDIDEANAITNRIGFGLDDPLNNPFDDLNVAPIKNHLNQNHWKFFLDLLQGHKDRFVTMLGEAPNNWTTKQATDEWCWLIENLQHMIVEES